MPRDPDLVAQEPARFGCELPEGNLNDLACSLMPDEAILATLLGGAEWYDSAGHHEYSDEVLLLLTTWRIHYRCYKHTRDGWRQMYENTVLWLGVDAFGGREGEEYLTVYCDSRGFIACWSWEKTVVAHNHFTDFMSTGQRKLQAVKFLSALTYAPGTSAISDQLERLVSLRQNGHISEQEFDQAKRRVLYG